MFMDPRTTTLARNLIRYSTDLQPGENVLIEMFDDAEPLAQALIAETYQAGGIPFLSLKNNRLQRKLLSGASLEQMQAIAGWESDRMRSMQAYIGVRASHNISELSDVPSEKLKLYQQYWSKPVHSEIRVKNTKWCVLRWPNASMAQLAGLSSEAFEDFYYNVCNLDYARMDQAMTPLVELMEKTDRVKIVGPDTDLAFSIKNIPVVKCSGLRNIPDGEVYTAPVRDSVNGTLAYNTPSIYQGTVYENVQLTFENGRIIQATANLSDRITEVFDTDEGSRYIGEFALGVNPFITKPMKDILFDEKIQGSFHFTPGNAYEEADNGNRSAIHWDLVCIQSPDWGGGEIWFDDRLIRKDGRFVPPELFGLNPENLK
jgi:aminopeptidase